MNKPYDRPLTGNRCQSMKRHPLYGLWRGMRYRCTCVGSTSYREYGGRGITVCERWDDFWKFAADMGDRPPGMTIDRLDNDGPYSPENCRWATRKQQMNNTRRSTGFELAGETYTIDELMAFTKVAYSVLYWRLAIAGWDVRRALDTPSKGTGGRYKKRLGIELTSGPRDAAGGDR